MNYWLFFEPTKLPQLILKEWNPLFQILKNTYQIPVFDH